MRAPRPSRSQLGTGALIVAALAVGQTLNEHLPDGSDAGRLFERPVSVDEKLEMRAGDLTPVSVDGATSILRDSGSSIRSPGVVVVVRFDYVARSEPAGISRAELRDGSGRVTVFSAFGQRSKVTCPAGLVGIVAHCTAVVEADPDTLVGATLGLSADLDDDRFDDMALIDLAIDDDDVAAYRQAEELEVEVYDVAGME